ncbi:importin beta SMX1 [Monosporozyma unispora]
MLNEQAILVCIEHTLVADAKVIKDAELQLFDFQKESGFSVLLLSMVSNQELPIAIRMSAAIYLKNKVQRSFRTENTKEKANPDDITPEEGNMIKENIIQVLINNAENNHIRPHLTEVIKAMLARSKSWDLSSIVTELLNTGKPEYMYAGLLLVFQMCDAHRYDMSGQRDQIDNFISVVFPTIENILSNLISQTDYRSSELLYLILKSFKYACLNNFPQYFNNVEKLNAWIKLHLFICSKPLPKEVLDLDYADRSLDKRVKVSKWGFGNLNRFIHRYSKTTKYINEEFVQYVNTQLCPEIIQEYFNIIQTWSQGSLWLSEASLYYLIQLFEKCLISDDLYSLIEPHLQTFIENVIFTCLCASSQTVELLEEDEEEYTRRYFDMNKEGSTADVASVDFIFVVGHKRPQKLDAVLPFVNNIFNEFVQSPDLNNAYKQEGAMRMISALFSFFDSNTEAIEGLFTHFISKIISQDKYPFLVARGLETVANFDSKFSNMDTLSMIYELTYNHLLNSQVIPIQIEAADGLKTLIVSNPEIHPHISGQVPGIMEKLLKLSKEFEIDILSEVMEAFVERFSDELTPFANDLASNLAEQFIRIARSVIESSSSGSNAYSMGDQDQEIQASSLLQTMTTMVMSMNKVSLTTQFIPVCKFVIQNAQIVFITEIVDLMDSLALSTKTLYNQFTPEIWDLFHDVMDSFETYALDYFEAYNVFFETVVLFGFPQDQTFVPQFLQILNVKLQSDIDYDIESVLMILQMYALSMKDIPLLDEAVKVGFTRQEELDLDQKEVIKLLLADLTIKPMETLQITESNGITLEFFKIWFDFSFTSAYAIKLQILAILKIFELNDLPGSVLSFTGEFANKLVSLIESLPKAIRRHQVISEGGEWGSEEEELNPEEEETFYEDFEDDFKETPLDELNAFNEVYMFFENLKNSNNVRYEQFISSMTEDNKSSLEVILNFVREKSQQ